MTTIKKNEASDAAEAELKKTQVKEMLLAVKDTNEIAKAMKLEQALREKEEDEKIIKYNRDKQYQEYLRQQEEKQARVEAEKALKKLRD